MGRGSAPRGVMAIACGAATAVAVHYDWPKAYWLVMTLAIVLRPYAVDSLERNRQRVIGTLAGAILAAAAVPLPRPVLLVSAAICMSLTVGVSPGEELCPAGHLHDADGHLSDLLGFGDDTLSLDGLR